VRSSWLGLGDDREAAVEAEEAAVGLCSGIGERDSGIPVPVPIPPVAKEECVVEERTGDLDLANRQTDRRDGGMIEREQEQWWVSLERREGEREERGERERQRRDAVQRMEHHRSL
jgi:hypothetical protein